MSDIYCWAFPTYAGHLGGFAKVDAIYVPTITIYLSRYLVGPICDTPRN